MADMKSTNKPTLQDWQLLNEAVKRANDGDQQALDWLRKFLDANPQVWGTLGDLARTAERAWIELISSGDALAGESIRRQLAQLKTDLVGESPSPVEKMLGDQVVATWLEVKYLEAVSADAKGQSLTQAGLLLKRLESAQKRHLVAIRSLVQTRKLLPNSGMPDLRIFPSERATG